MTQSPHHQSPHDQSPHDQDDFDLVVIGGGPAGLSAAKSVSRLRRSVLVVDAGQPRNASADGVHNYLGREGTPPAELLAIARDEVKRYGATVEDGTVTTVERTADGFVVSVSPLAPASRVAGAPVGPSEALLTRQVHARRLLLATGLRDELPPVAGLEQGWGRTVLHCPFCHGWEVRDQAIGVLATNPFAAHQALMFRQLSDDLVLFLHTAPAPSPEDRELLDALGVRLVEGEVVGWEPGGVRLADGSLVPRDALVVSPVFTAQADAVRSLGLTAEPFEMNGYVAGSQVPADANGRTPVDGVFAAGNVTSMRAQVMTAAAEGLWIGAQIVMDLVTEDNRLALDRHRQVVGSGQSA